MMNSNDENDEEEAVNAYKSLSKKGKASAKHQKALQVNTTSVEDIEAGLKYLRRLNEYYDA
jgi:hypothetical protein